MTSELHFVLTNFKFNYTQCNSQPTNPEMTKMEMNSPTQVPDHQYKISDDQPYVDGEGTLVVPLTGDRWELLVDHTGTISLSCCVAPIDDRPAQRWIATIGEIHEEIEDHESLVESINYVRSQGQSIAHPN